MNLANVAIAKWDENIEKWVAQMPKDLPDWVKDPQVIADIVEGGIVELNGEFYYGHVTGDTGLVLPQGFVKSVQ